jgi:ribosomal protein S18 acetylase RimI-like enzyme
MNRAWLFMGDLARTWRKKGIWTAFSLVRKRIFEQNLNLFYELRATGAEPDLPEGWFVAVVPSPDDAAIGLLLKAGGHSELGYFHRNAVAFVMCIGDEVVAHHWHFPNHPLAQWLGPDAAYVGKALVKPEWRGQGINAKLLTFTATHLHAGSRIVLEVEPTNVSSQKSLIKAGCVLLGRLQTTECFARLISVRLEGSPLPAHRTLNR